MASRSAIAIAVATRRSSRWRSGGTSGSNSSMRSRPSANSAAPLGMSRMAAELGRRSIRVEQHQQLQLALGGAAPDDRGHEVARAADHVAGALLQRDHRPADIRQHLPEMHPAGVEAAVGGAFIGLIKRRACRDATGLAVEPGKAPALAAEPADIL